VVDFIKHLRVDMEAIHPDQHPGVGPLPIIAGAIPIGYVPRFFQFSKIMKKASMFDFFYFIV
jgi:hypothetical protein